MKTLIACLLVTTAARAGTINLPLPTIAQIAPSIPVTACPAVAYLTPHTVATGFSADGNYVLGVASSVYVCGHSGRGSNLRDYYYCASFVWDLSGNLVSTTVGTCPLDPEAKFETFTNGAYTAETYYVVYYGSVQYEYPVLVTP